MSMTHAVRCLTLGMPTLLFGGQPKARAGNQGLALNVLGVDTRSDLLVGSSAFGPGQELPPRFSAAGGNRSPPISWSGMPAETRSLALLVEDPDAPTPKPFLHWMVYAISPRVSGFPEGEANGALEGKNSLLKLGYTGAAPPRGDRPHRYHFQLFALRLEPKLPAALGRRALLTALRGQVIAAADCIATFAR
jgi:Raf kinase inhibitor-like YbhB/YbcL family protein